ncbi:MAG: acyltransferase family protein [Christensenellales bacterium]|jgi:surface polysaccharide O-acyltransferase-like enzyme
MQKYIGIDIGRVIFACLIPILHIPFPDNIGIYIIRQYISRLGVPFFFAVSGMFLCKSREKYGAKDALKRYLSRIGRVFLIWLLIYLPILIAWAESYVKLIQRLLFRTPAYLWYLSSLLFAAIPFCLVKNRKILLGCAMVLYFFGTLFGDTYKWLLGGVSWYEDIFLTTRNGIFFGFPLMCVGELTWRAKKGNILLLIVSGFALIAEITFVGVHAEKFTDRSMYILLPVFVYALMLMIREWNPDIEGKYLRRISFAIYVMQYGIITVGTMALTRIGLNGTNAMWLVYIAVIVIPLFTCWIFQNKRILKVIY